MQTNTIVVCGAVCITVVCCDPSLLSAVAGGIVGKYIYIYIYIHICIYIYMYLIERERETIVCVYIYIYIYIHMSPWCSRV